MRTVLITILFLISYINNEAKGEFSWKSAIPFFNARYNRDFDRVTSALQLNKYGFEVQRIDPDIIADAFATTPQLLKRHGYSVETHSVRTPDGYRLEMHRIPKKGGVPVYLQHGILDSSAAWVLMGPKSALAYQLSDLGYDVWMGNVRGNRYCRSHVKLQPQNKEFWDFSFHEIGVFDVPAMIDHILENTNHSKIHYVGHSQGTTAFWVMCSERPVYCKKIISMNALAPVAFMPHTKSPVIRAIVPFLDQVEVLFKLMGVYEFMPNNDFLTLGGQLLCKREAVTQVLCMNAIFLVAGYNTEQLNKTMLPAILGHVPAGSATKQLIHYGQLIKSGRFRQFDYGWIKNIIKYGSLKPPEYDFSQVKVPVVLHYSKNDWLAQPMDVEKLAKSLPNVIRQHLVPLDKFNHLDFIFAIRCRELINNEVVKVLETISEKNKIETSTVAL